MGNEEKRNVEWGMRNVECGMGNFCDKRRQNQALLEFC